MAAERHDALYFDEVQVGDRWISQGRTITETDVVNFAGLTGDYNPLHVDHEYARRTPFGRPIVHGMLGMSLVAGLGSHSPNMQTAAFVRVVEWRFVKPLFIGDTVHVETEVVGRQENARRRGLITWVRRLINQHGDVVQEGTTETLVQVKPSRSVAPGKVAGRDLMVDMGALRVPPPASTATVDSVTRSVNP
jgi:3-hydroxybutyryl-CoA dehydratase